MTARPGAPNRARGATIHTRVPTLTHRQLDLCIGDSGIRAEPGPRSLKVVAVAPGRQDPDKKSRDDRSVLVAHPHALEQGTTRGRHRYRESRVKPSARRTQLLLRVGTQPRASLPTRVSDEPREAWDVSLHCGIDSPMVVASNPLDLCSDMSLPPHEMWDFTQRRRLRSCGCQRPGEITGGARTPHY